MKICSISQSHTTKYPKTANAGKRLLEIRYFKRDHEKGNLIFFLCTQSLFTDKIGKTKKFWNQLQVFSSCKTCFRQSIIDVTQRIFSFYPPPFSRYVLNVSLPSNRTSLIATIPSLLNRNDFLLLKTLFARKYAQCFSYDIHVYLTKGSGNKIQPHESSQSSVSY